MGNLFGTSNSNFLSHFLSVVILIGLNTFTFKANADQSNTITLATSEVSPFSSEHNQLQGYINEVIHLTFKEIGITPKFEFYPHARAIYLADSGQIEGVFPLHRSEEPLKGMVYSDAIPGGSINYLVHNNRKIENLFEADLGDSVDQFVGMGLTRLGVLRGSQIPESLSQTEKIHKLLAKSLPTLLDMLERGRVDFIYIDEYSAKQAIINHRPHLAQKFKFIKPLKGQNPYFLGLSKQLPNAQKFIERFNRALASLQADGTIDKVLKRYGIYIEPTNPATKRKVIVGAPNINGIETAIRYINSSDTPFSALEIQWRVMEESILRKHLLGDSAVNETQFDLVMLGNFEVPIWAKNGWLLPFTQPPSTYDVEDIIPIARHSNTYQGAVYGLPFVGETTLTFYRKDLLTSANIEMPAPLTYQKLKAIASSLHNPENQIYGVGLRTQVGWGQNMALVSTMVNTYGGKWFDEDMKPMLTTKSWERAVSDYVSLVVESGPPDNHNLGWKENQQLFADGKLAFFVDASSLGGYLLDPAYSKVSEHVGVTYAPIGKTREGAQWFWSWNFAVPQQSQNVAAAQALAYWLTSKGFIASIQEKYGHYAAPAGTRHSTYTSSYLSAIPYARYEYDALLATDVDNLNVPTTGNQFVPIPEFTALGYLVGVQVNLAVKQLQSVDEALKAAQYQSEAVMKRAGYYKN
ncbi:extracellular solute-binding protein [Alteromonas sp. 1_MG-2023]|uniref:extracellular solute-binding protein n=1 Tax=Alteromonas sp. 1_MG-2023 TaxID=3062669 RepID=UPI0026E38AFF|nr:extracellular solute-binding protein [Alteromonas sp. 1_MG-2023]MDO6567251.1 extracellular solute-binding protein [Alteromonas sp. 1_MG-2023]